MITILMLSIKQLLFEPLLDGLQFLGRVYQRIWPRFGSSSPSPSTNRTHDWSHAAWCLPLCPCKWRPGQRQWGPRSRLGLTEWRIKDQSNWTRGWREQSCGSFERWSCDFPCHVAFGSFIFEKMAHYLFQVTLRAAPWTLLLGYGIFRQARRVVY